MWIMLITLTIIFCMLVQIYQEGKNNNTVRLSYRQSKCSSCKKYNNVTHTCILKKDFSKCYSWEKQRGW